MLVKPRIHKAHVRLLFLFRHLVSAISLSPCCELLKLHHITSQGAGLIAEYVLNLSQLFIEVTGLCPHLNLLFFIKHLHIVCHHKGLPELHHFKSYQERYRNEIGLNQDPCSEHLEPR